ncbi:hypothetical protein PZ895_14360 [Mesorhizobium sp. YIM 152430]|uniref:hypothetical protein n=1 Tax=Mesorhizobium sp. YIM 152430 TaxID=3031761 RepID=UPI0023DC52C4|nr:hypothetical protein [Mesorhizobium sp. YIM 152430]MDF1600942.1 hypothetical protein [Mesorhizobium sp. YIM 152430]
MTRSRQTHTITWQGRTIEVRYEPRWLGSDGPFNTAHLELEVIEPARSPLPVTETGYRSCFLKAQLVEEMGGPVAFALSWLDQSAKTQSWKDSEHASRQMSLF